MVTFCFVTSGVHAASFDCNKATTLVEKAICSEAQLSELDERLTQFYKQGLANADDADVLKFEQKLWLKNVRNKCHGSACLKRAYIDRIAIFSDQKISGVPSLGGVTGAYQREGASLDVQQVSGNRIKFQISSIRNMGNGQINTGGASGEASLNGDTAVYVNSEEDCGLVFKFSTSKVSVTENGGCGSVSVSNAGNYKLIQGKSPKFDN